MIEGEIWRAFYRALDIYNKNKEMLNAIENKHTHAYGNVGQYSMIKYLLIKGLLFPAKLFIYFFSHGIAVAGMQLGGCFVIFSHSFK